MFLYFIIDFIFFKQSIKEISIFFNSSFAAWLTEFWFDLTGKEYSRENLDKMLKELKENIAYLEKAAQKSPEDFSRVCKEKLGFDFNPEKVEEFILQSQEYTLIQQRSILLQARNPQAYIGGHGHVASDAASSQREMTQLFFSLCESMGYKLILRNKVPDLQLSGGYAYLPGSNSKSGEFEHGAYAGGSLVNLPIFYNFTPEIENARLKIKQAELNLKSTQNKAIKDVTASYERFLTALENLNQYEEKIITGSENLINISKKSYEKGEIDIVSLIVMKQSYKSIIIGYTQALTDYYNSWTNVLREINNESFVLENETL